MPEFIRHPGPQPAEWDRYKAERLQPRIAERTASAGRVRRGALPAMDRADPDRRSRWGVFGTARDMMGAEELLLAFYDEPGPGPRHHDSTYTDLWLALYEEAATQSRSTTSTSGRTCPAGRAR